MDPTRLDDLKAALAGMTKDEILAMLEASKHAGPDAELVASYLASLTAA